MPPKCFQTLDNGQRCSALAIHGSRFCRHHHQQGSNRPAKEKLTEMEPLALPPLLDKPSILAALNVVVQALAEGRIKRSVAETLLSAIKLANRLITEIAEAGETVFPATSRLQPPTVALAASGSHSSGIPSHRYPGHAPDDDPATARLVRELVAQSHEFARSQKAASSAA